MIEPLAVMASSLGSCGWCSSKDGAVGRYGHADSWGAQGRALGHTTWDHKPSPATPQTHKVSHSGLKVGKGVGKQAFVGTAEMYLYKKTWHYSST